MSQPQSNRRWYRLTPDRAVLGLLAVEGLFLLSERFRWFAFNQHKGWTVLIAAATVAVTLLLLGLWFLAALVFRLRFQFSLLTLFVLTLVAAVPCSWLATEMQQAERQRAAVEAITGGSPVYDDEREVSNGFVYEDRFGPFGPTDQPNWFERIGVDFDFNIGGAPPAWPQNWLEKLGKDFFQNAVAVDLFSGEDVHAKCELLKRLPELGRLRVVSDKVTDADLEHLNGLSQLKELIVGCPSVTDAGLEPLAGLKKLKTLAFVSAKITDAGLPRLEALENLDELWLSDTKVTDGGLERLRRLTKLRRLHLGNPGVTEAGIKRLQQAMPWCVITSVRWERFRAHFDDFSK